MAAQDMSPRTTLRSFDPHSPLRHSLIRQASISSAGTGKLANSSAISKMNTPMTDDYDIGKWQVSC